MIHQPLLLTGGLLELLGSVGILVAGWIANQYVIPFLKVGRRHRYAQLIATLADEITDDLRERYSEKEWLSHLDEAIDRLAEVLGIDNEVARRAVRAAVARKKARTAPISR